MIDLRELMHECTEVHSTTGSRWQIPCRCDAARNSGKAHLWVDPDAGTGWCFRCQRAYSILDLVQWLTGYTYADAVELLRRHDAPAERLRRAMRSLESQAVRVQSAAASAAVALPNEYRPILRSADVPPYLRQRQVTFEQCVIHQIGVCVSGYFANRVVIPVWGADWRLLSFVARWMGPQPKDGKKVLYPKGSQISRACWNHQNAAEHREVVICEGIFDALRVGACAVALNGKHASREQLAQLVALGQSRTLIVLLDTDAVLDAERIARALAAACPDVRMGRLPAERKDPGELTEKEVQHVLRTAKSVGRRRLKDVIAAL